nr:hypothetical protein [Tanacetum cinerariifolium]
MSSSSKGSKSYSKSSGKSAQAEELVFETTDIDMPLNQREDLGNTYDQPNVEVASKDDRFKKPERPLTSDLDWNTTKSIDFKQPQTWINKISKEGKPPRTFDELMSTPIDFSAYIKPLPLIEDQGRQVVPANYFINNDLEYLKGGSSIRQYTTSTTKTKAAKYDTIKSIEDMVPSLWSLVKKKLFNLEKDVIYDLNVALRMFTRCVVILKRVEDLQLGVESYQKKLNITRPKNFSLKMDYLEKIRWSKLDKKEHQSDTKVFTMMMEILPEPTSNKLYNSYWIKTSQDSSPHAHTRSTYIKTS